MALGGEIRGVQGANEISSTKRYVDTRPWWVKFQDSMGNTDTFLMYSCIPIICSFFFPAFLELGILLSISFILIGQSIHKKTALPFKMPKSSGLTDPNELNPVNDKPTDADGIGYFGIERTSKKELWFTNSDLRTHILMMGSTGSGKTEALLSLAFNSLSWGSGFVYVDGKGTAELYTKIYAMCRQVGREDDVLVINYMKGNRDLFGPQETKLSNTMNPFTSGSAGSLTELVVSLMEDGGSDGMWKGRAMALIAAIMQALVFLRDNKEILLDVEVIRDYLILDKIVTLSKKKNIPPHIMKGIKSYLTSIPGYVEGSTKQSDTTLEQHGYLQMQFTKVLSTLADAYAHIFKTNLGEVNFWDVVVNRRILVVLLPALEFSEPELANLGKIIIACLRAMMATGLGSMLEGTIQEVVEVNPTKGNTPFITILDEYGYYAVKGSAVMPAQARGLGFCMCFAGQDYPSFKKASPEEAAAIAANCNIKICLKLEDPQETYELFKAAAGQSNVTVQSGYDVNDNTLFGGKGYKSTKNVNIDTRDRIDLRDLQTQRPGEAHIFFAGHIVRATFFYANPPKAQMVRVNYFMKVQPPEKQELLDMQSGILEIINKLSDLKTVKEINMAIEQTSNLKDFEKIRNWLDYDKNAPLHERAIQVLAEYEFLNKKVEDKIIASKEDPIELKDVDVFSNTEETPHLINKKDIIEQMSKIESFRQENTSEIEERNHNLLNDMKSITRYGINDAPEDLDFEVLAGLIDELDDRLGGSGNYDDDDEDFDDFDFDDEDEDDDN